MHIRPPILLTLGLLSGLTPFAIDMYLPSLPVIALDLGSSIELAQLTVTVYLGVFALAQLFLGPLSDVRGRRSTIGGGLALFCLGSLGCALAGSMETLIAARVVQALGGAAVAVTVPALVRDLCEKDECARVLSLVMLVMSLAPLLAPSIGGLIVGQVGWHWVFIALYGIGLLAIGLFFALLPETLPPARRHPADVGRVLRNYLQLMHHRTGMGYLLVGAFSFGGMMTYIVTSPFVYIILHAVPTAWFAVLFGLNVAAAMVTTTLNARLVTRLGAERLLRLGLAVQVVAALLLLGLALWGTPPLWAIVLATLLYLGVAGVVLGNAMAGYMMHFAPMAGTASAFSGAARFGTGAIVGSLVSLAHDGTARPLLLGMALCGLLAGLSYLWLVAAPRGLLRPAVPQRGGLSNASRTS
ncbi:Bcr/CflA family multidrug efflux MFS transporter [uncultured Thiodictyon sp.]|jgi:DHA1 family bicyclomycin/chloramphenicol resistance-like MFS transporter|uniref:Bcr/CflA family multidrug efflux MFS transporter n=1 Tax=uncultured Thiodictyon sp. TaxID=1846217 RepID=UPI0025E2DA9A|nr:Bcr/CflA family multidrug efflux MFS transporter [uncultured Thiodictyon sp.]